MLRAAVIGVGSLGRHHARIYNELPEAALVAVCDIDRGRAEEYAAQYGCDAVTDYRELLGRIDVASVAAPTVEHAAIGCELLGAGVGTLVEKPIAASLEEAGRLIEVARDSATASATGASFTGCTLTVTAPVRDRDGSLAMPPYSTT